MTGVLIEVFGERQTLWFPTFADALAMVRHSNVVVEWGFTRG